MPNETIKLTTPRSGATWKRAGLFISTIGVIVLLVALIYGYAVLSKVTLSLSDRVTTLSGMVRDAQAELVSMQNKMVGLSDTVAKSQQALDLVAAEDAASATRYQQLATLDRAVDQLVLSSMPSTLPPTSNIAAQQPLPPNTWWGRGWASLKQALSKIITVRYIGSDNLLYQYLHAEIQSAMWGVLHHNNAVYQTSLARAITWAGQYFSKDAPTTQSFIADLQTLQQVDVTRTTT
jgi:uncharacterized protein HemX